MRDDMHLFSLKERIFFVKTFYKNNSDLRSVKNHYILEYGPLLDEPTDSVVFEVISLFEETGSVREVPGFHHQDKKEETDSFNDPKKVLITEIKLEEPEEEESKEPEVKEETPEIFTSMTSIDFSAPEEDEPEITKTTPKKRGRKPKPGSIPRKRRIKPKTPTHYDCGICKKRLTSKPGFKHHMRRHGEEIDEGVCKYCNETFPSKIILKGHLKEKHGNEIDETDPPKKCPICFKMLKNGNNVQRHILTHKKKRDVICHYCGKTYKSKSILLTHLRIHNNVNPYKCAYPNCSRSFNNANSHAIHMRCHTGERPFSCEECGKGFKDKTALTIHHRQHTGENPYKCELCGKTTKQRQNLKSHMKHFHHINTFKTQAAGAEK